MYDSIYYADINTVDISKVEEIYARIQLNTANTWEIEGTTTIPGFTVEEITVLNSSDLENAITYSIHDIENVLYIHLVKNDNCTATGEQTVASIPIRVWSYCGTESGANYTPAEAWTKGSITAVSVNIEVELGEVVYNDNTTKTFSADKLHIDTEAYIHQYKMDKTYFANNTYHVHNAVAVDDVAATCSTNGYTGRTYCEV